MLQNAYFLAKIGVDTAEHEPRKIIDSAAGEYTELVASRLLKADLSREEMRSRPATRQRSRSVKNRHACYRPSRAHSERRSSSNIYKKAAPDALRSPPPLSTSTRLCGRSAAGRVPLQPVARGTPWHSLTDFCNISTVFSEISQNSLMCC